MAHKELIAFTNLLRLVKRLVDDRLVLIRALSHVYDTLALLRKKKVFKRSKILDASDMEPAEPSEDRSVSGEYVFHYETHLERKAIRLFLLHEGSGDDALSCELQDFNLEGNRSYKALSYLCGKEIAAKPILCNGRPLQIYANLYEALWYARKRRESSLMWADAICIDQSNMAEKTKQVALMRDIFAQAESVMVWLGSPTNRDAEVFELLKMLYDAVGGKITTMAFSNQYVQSSEFLPLEEFGLPSLSGEIWQCLWRLLSRPLFTRVWIIQELVVANKCTTYCGDLHIDTEILLAGSAIVGYFTNLAMMAGVSLSEDSQALLNNGKVTALIRYYSENDEQLNLHELIALTTSYGATDHRDRVFALAGIAEDRPLFLIDYTKNIREVLIETARYGILMQPRHAWTPLDMLSNVYVSKNQLGLPSWVPDLRVIEFAFRELGYDFHSRGTTETQCIAFDSEDALRSQGYLFDKIDLTVPSTKLGLPSEASTRDFDCRRLAEETLSKGSHFTSEDARGDLYWRTICFHQSGETEQHINHSSYQAFLLLLKKSKQERARDISILELAQIDFEATALYRAAIPFLIEMLKYRRGRSFFAFANGNIGWVPSRAIPGDDICILKGCRIPYILRAQGGGGRGYELIGGAYIGGMMEHESGEAVEVGSWQEIRIC